MEPYKELQLLSREMSICVCTVGRLQYFGNIFALIFSLNAKAEFEIKTMVSIFKTK
jgi:hypothetical protein